MSWSSHFGRNGPEHTPILAASLPVVVAIWVAALLSVAAVPFTQSDGDLFAHIAWTHAWTHAWTQGHVGWPRGSLLGWADASATDAPAAWAGSAFVGWCRARGGLALVAGAVALLAAMTHAGLARLLQWAQLRPLHALAAAASSATLAASHWLARPHAFSLAASALLLAALLQHRRSAPYWIVPLFAVWANLHGGWIVGVAMLGAFLAGELVAPLAGDERHAEAGHHRHRALGRLGLLALAMGATCLTPYGLALHTTIWRSLQHGHLMHVVDEYRPVGFTEPADLLAIGAFVISAMVVWRRRRDVPLAWLGVIVVSLLAAWRVSRFVAVFAVTGWPLVLILLGAPATIVHRRRVLVGTPTAAAVGGRTTLGRYRLTLATAAAAVATALAVNAWRQPLVVDRDRFPVGAIPIVAREAPHRLLTGWTWSGYVPYACPGARTWFDPLLFSSTTLQAYATMLEQRPGADTLLERFAIDAVLLPADQRTGAALRTHLQQDPAWRTVWHDGTAVLFRRISAPAPTSATRARWGACRT